MSVMSTKGRAKKLLERRYTLASGLPPFQQIVRGSLVAGMEVAHVAQQPRERDHIL